MDAQEESYARSVAEEGALRASEHGYEASPMTKESFDGIAKAVLEVADDLSARVIVCGQRGRGPLRSALLGERLAACRGRTPDARFSLLLNIPRATGKGHMTNREQSNRSPVVVADPSDPGFPCSLPMSSELSEFGERRELAAGEVLYRAGEAKWDFFVLHRGRGRARSRR